MTKADKKNFGTRHWQQVQVLHKIIPKDQLKPVWQPRGPIGVMKKQATSDGVLFILVNMNEWMGCLVWLVWKINISVAKARNSCDNVYLFDPVTLIQD